MNVTPSRWRSINCQHFFGYLSNFRYFWQDYFTCMNLIWRIYVQHCNSTAKNLLWGKHLKNTWMSVQGPGAHPPPPQLPEVLVGYECASLLDTIDGFTMWILPPSIQKSKTTTFQLIEGKVSGKSPAHFKTQPLDLWLQWTRGERECHLLSRVSCHNPELSYLWSEVKTGSEKDIRHRHWLPKAQLTMSCLWLADTTSLAHPWTEWRWIVTLTASPSPTGIDSPLWTGYDHGCSKQVV